MKRAIYAKVWILCAVLISCVDEINIEDYVGKPTNTLVVQGMITDRPMIQTIRLTRTNEVIPKNPPPTVSGATVSISDGANTFSFTEDPEIPGTYQSQSEVYGTPGKHYTLTVIVDGAVYNATDTMPEVRQFDETDRLGFSYDNPRGSKGYIQRSLVQYGVAAPSIVSIELQDAPSSVSPSQIHYYALPGIDPDNVFPKFTEAIPFETKSTFKQMKYGISEQHYFFLRAMLLETEYYGGFFGSVRANVPTNITNGGLGFFSACSVNERFITSR